VELLLQYVFAYVINGECDLYVFLLKTVLKNVASTYFLIHVTLVYSVPYFLRCFKTKICRVIIVIR